MKIGIDSVGIRASDVHYHEHAARLRRRRPPKEKVIFSGLMKLALPD